MPGQYVNSRYSRPVMSGIRCFCNALHLWVLMHASSIVVVVQERCDKGFFWDTRLPDKLTYYDALYKVPAGECLIFGMIVGVMNSIYVASGCKLVGSQDLAQIGRKPRLDKICVCTPYIGAFLGCWLFSTYVLMNQMFMRHPRGTSPDIYTQLIIALLFKFLIMANMISLCLRTYARLLKLTLEWNRGYISTLNFGEWLNLFFRN
ncbi:uncharacterized protein LOC110177806 [Drosophila serrata]|uniref:uncharacterized protein LOC110177806 n=1 Tax=Drosophila serrata TaxID=7274 RepID=UPI000A1D3A4D|nr:uncharacterized protein LOC110177806 [Drosophila serrata]